MDYDSYINLPSCVDFEHNTVLLNSTETTCILIIQDWLSIFIVDPRCDQFLVDLSKKLCEINVFVRGKYGPLCCLVDVLGAQAMLEIHPRIAEDLMFVMSDQNIVPHVRRLR